MKEGCTWIFSSWEHCDGQGEFSDSMASKIEAEKTLTQKRQVFALALIHIANLESNVWKINKIIQPRIRTRVW
jgi:hypothetical protein